jgi:hypothetical protein
VAEIVVNNDGMNRTSYDYWKLFRDGRFYTMLSLFEDERAPNRLWWDTRINRVTEALLLLARLYRRLGAGDTDEVAVRIGHGGLSGRTIAAANRSRMTRGGRLTSEDEVEASFTAALSDLESNLPDYVKQIVQPLFVVFDFFEISDRILGELVDSFAAGSVA